MEKSRNAIALAERLSHPFSVGSAYGYCGWLNIMLRNERAAFEYSERAVNMGREQGFPQLIALGSMIRGSAITERDRLEEGIAILRESVQVHRNIGVRRAMPFFLTVLAEKLKEIGRVDEAESILAEVLVEVEEYGEGMWESETHRLKGELLLERKAQASEAESCFRKALEVSRSQKAKSLELRAAMSMARLWQKQGKKNEAQELLSGVYGWFTEGFDTQDLLDAKALLEELS